MSKTTGHCLCGAIRYEYVGEPVIVAHCHCESCRRHTASPVATFVIVRAAGLRYTADEPVTFASSPSVTRSFCGRCGSPIAYRTERRPDMVDLYAGTLSDPTTVAVNCHVHAAEQLPWFEILDDLPRFAEASTKSAPLRLGPRR